MFRNYEMAAQTLTLTPVSVPAEILSLIAEACVEPYQIRVDRDDGVGGTWSFLQAYRPQTPQVTLNPPIPRLKAVCPDFKIGIERVSRGRFNGHLICPGDHAAHVPAWLTQCGYAWIMPEVTSITFAYEFTPYQYFSTTSMVDPYLAYTNFQNVNVVSLRTGLDGILFLIERELVNIKASVREQFGNQQPLQPQTIPSSVNNFAADLGSLKWTNPVFGMKIVVPQHKSKMVYTHMKWAFNGSELQDFGMYDTESFDW